MLVDRLLLLDRLELPEARFSQACCGCFGGIKLGMPPPDVFAVVLIAFVIAVLSANLFELDSFSLIFLISSVTGLAADEDATDDGALKDLKS